MRVQLDKYQYFHEFEDDIVVMSMKNIIKHEKSQGQFRDKKVEEAAKTILELLS